MNECTSQNSSHFSAIVSNFRMLNSITIGNEMLLMLKVQNSKHLNTIFWRGTRIYSSVRKNMHETCEIEEI